MNLMIISRILESIPIYKSSKITTITADNGKKALDLVLSRKKNIVLILMDCEMPIMDGYEASKMIRESGSTVMIVGISGHSGD